MSTWVAMCEAAECRWVICATPNHPLASYLAPAPVQSPHLGGFGRPFCPLVEVSAQHFRYKATSSRDCCPNGAHASETKQQDNQEPN
jgi:hypothetical protein